ncbi:hypothetical protein BJ170DRAFT_687615 [Xylariales sp. AK1849]|nr:hypothetical protein BJ170DRAFT_687615 [Xylariales sp. AK1849]
MPPVPPIPSMLKLTSNGQGRLSSPKEKGGAATIPHASSSSLSRHNHQIPPTDRAAEYSTHRLVDHQSRPIAASDDRQRRRMAERDDQERQLREQEDAAQHAERVARQEKETDRRLAQQKKNNLGRLEVQLANNNQQVPVRSPKARSPVVEKFVMLTKRRKSKEGLATGLSPTSSTAGSVAGSVDLNQSRTELPEVPKLPPGIEVGGKGIVPQKDAPVSAVNHGDRIVSVRCKQHTFILPVTPETTPVDIVLETAKNMTYDLEWSPTECIVLESYGPLGLERRIRRFEHIRDVMNSWDRDTHNHLIVSVSDDPGHDRDLDVNYVSENAAPPQGFQLYMYHSNRPGKWNKRWITLAENGQILCSKKPDANPADKDTLSLCHLSDYDIYTPKASQMRRNLKPPKKHCFAVKSLHKPAMFMNTENYVQYFCSEDPKTAAQFSEKVQAWRSWYLVDRRPAARRVSIPKTAEKPPQLTSVKYAPKKTVNVAAVDGHRLRISVDESPYTIGEFEPLIDLKRFDKRLSQFGKDFLPPVPNASTMPKGVPSHLKDGPQDNKSEGPLIDNMKSANDGAFTGNGLLGEGYKNRKAAVSDKEPPNKRFSKDLGDFGGNAFTDGPSLLNKEADSDAAPNKAGRSWFPSALEHTAKHRDVFDTIRPSTSAGVMRTHRPSHVRSQSQSRPPPIPQQSRLRSERSDAHPHPLGSHRPNAPSGPPDVTTLTRREPPKPLVDLSPTINEPPQWSKKGHGVQAPEGMHHLIDLISVGNARPSGLLEVPQRSPMRRGPNSAPFSGGPPSSVPAHRSGGGLSRTRSKSSGAPPSRPMKGDVPPMPLLPGRNQGRGPSDKSQIGPPRGRELRDHRDSERGRGREREVDYYPVSGRTGTLKVV